MRKVNCSPSVSTILCIHICNLHYIDNHYVLFEKTAVDVRLLAPTCHFRFKHAYLKVSSKIPCTRMALISLLLGREENKTNSK